VEDGPHPDRTLSLLKALPETDPAYEIIAGILRVVPASRWTFARVEPSGALVSLYTSHDRGAGLSELSDEFKRQRIKAPKGPRIAAALGPLEDYASGITLLFADARASFGILTLLRKADEGSFTSTEIRMLTFAVDEVSDRLSALRLHRAPQRPDRPAAEDVERREDAAEPDAAFYVLDQDLQIVLAWNPVDRRRVALTGLHTRIAERLPTLLEDTVRELTSSWYAGDEQAVGTRRPVPFLVVRTQPMSGPAGLFIGVHIDRYHTSNSLTGAALRFHISPREVQVLALLLDGNRLDQIAKQLHITSSTVQDHIKSMLDKTDSRNRSELIARVLGWESSPGAEPD
jgi:DNA-binding CsgD family transcriptional regulator